MKKYVGVFTLVCVGVLCVVTWRTMITTEHVTRIRLVPRLNIWSQLAHLQSTNEGATNHTSGDARLVTTSTVKIGILFSHPNERYAAVDDVPADSLPQQVDCAAIFHNNATEITKAEKLNANIHILPDDKQLLSDATNCAAFVAKRRYILNPVSAEEREFPIGFSIIVFRDAPQVERLLRAIYRPQNVYCIHVDRKAPDFVYQSLLAVARCLGNNVIVPANRTDVQWGWFSVLEPEIVCMHAIVDSGLPFKYFLNLAGQEFPLKTNLEIVRILSIFNGTNNILADLKSERLFKNRIEFVYKDGRRTRQRKPAPPHNLTLYKGQVHIAASRAFVDYVTTSRVASDLLDWLKDTAHPDETFFSSLNYNYHVGVPGVFTGGGVVQSKVRWKRWRSSGYRCRGRYVRDVCVLGVGDLPELLDSTELFVNKLHYNYQPVAYDCLQQLHYNRTRRDILHPNITESRIDLNHYRHLNFVRRS